MCARRPEAMAGRRGRDDLSPWIGHSTCLSSLSFLCLLYFGYKHVDGAAPSLGAHNSPERPQLEEASQTQRDAKTSYYGGNLHDYKIQENALFPL